MIKVDQIALELLEYKVGDLLASREVKGGVASAWELFYHLKRDAAVLTRESRQRLNEAERILQNHSKTLNQPKVVMPSIDSLVLEDFALSGAALRELPVMFDEAPPLLDLDPEALDEQAVLQRLAKRVWWSEMDAVVNEFAVQCRAEKNRATARLLYALSRNLERYLKASGEISDLNLARFRISEPVPERLDPLISLNNIDSLSELVRDIIESIMFLADSGNVLGEAKVPRGQALGFVKRMALAIARDPYAGEVTPVPQRGPNSASIRLAIQEVDKETLREEQKQLQRKALEERLRITLAHERQQRATFKQDVQAFTAIVDYFFDRLERYLPGRAGGEAGEPQLRGGVLFAVNPAVRIRAVDRDASSVTVRLKGPTRFMLAGLEFAVTGEGSAKTLYVNGQDYALQPRLKLSVERHQVMAVQEGVYLYLKVLNEARSLTELLAETVAAYFILSSSYGSDLVKLLKVAANVVVAEPHEAVAQIIERLRETSGRAPDRRQALEGLIRGAGRASSIELPDNLIISLVQRLYLAMTVGSDELTTVLDSVGEAQVAVHTFSDEPLNTRIAGQAVTVRKYRGRGRGALETVAVMVPGRVVGSFHSYMVQPFAGGTLVCARAEGELASLFFEGVGLEL